MTVEWERGTTHKQGIPAGWNNTVRIIQRRYIYHLIISMSVPRALLPFPLLSHIARYCSAYLPEERGK